jgi:hypothetical protein
MGTRPYPDARRDVKGDIGIDTTSVEVVSICAMAANARER